MPVKLTYVLASGPTDKPIEVVFPRDKEHTDIRVMGRPVDGMTFIGANKTYSTGPLANWSLELVDGDDEPVEGKKKAEGVMQVDEVDLLVLQAALVALPTAEMDKDHLRAHTALLRRVYKLRGIEPGEEE